MAVQFSLGHATAWYRHLILTWDLTVNKPHIPGATTEKSWRATVRSSNELSVNSAIPSVGTTDVRDDLESLPYGHVSFKNKKNN